MEIKHIGLTGVMIKTKKVTILIDPLAKDTGVKAQPKKADIVCVSRPGSPYYDSSKIKDAYVIDKPGEYEIKGVMIFALPIVEDKELGIVYYICAEDIPILHLGGLKNKPKDGLLDEIHGVDILLLPVGGMFSLTPKKAREMIPPIDPAFVLPINYSIEGLVPELKRGLGPLSEFLKMVNKKKSEPENKFRIKKSQIRSEEDRKVETVVISPSGFKKR